MLNNFRYILILWIGYKANDLYITLYLPSSIESRSIIPYKLLNATFHTSYMIRYDIYKIKNRF